MSDEERDSIYELQNIDCNCNDCAFMIRDFGKYEKSTEWHRSIEESEFEKNKAKAISDAEAMTFGAERDGMLRVAHKMRFQFDRNSVLIFYGTCTKFNKSVSFIPKICQIETQACFLHRKANQKES